MDRVVRVLHVLGGLDAGGAENFVMNVYQKIDREKIQFDFVKHTNKKQFFDEEIQKLGGKIYSCPKYNFINHIAYCRWWKQFFLAHPEYLIIHGHVRSTASIYMKISKKNRRIAIAHSHNTSNGSGFSAIIKKILQKQIKWYADYLFACSERAGIWLYGKEAVKRNNYKMIPNAIDCERFSYNPIKRDEIRKKYQLDNLFLYDTPGLGDDPLKDSLYKENLVCMLNKTNNRKDRFS